MWQLTIETRRRLRRNRHRLAFVFGRMLGYRYETSPRLDALIGSQGAPELTNRPVVLVSFHTDGMYGLLALARMLDRPLICLVTREAQRAIALFRWRPANVRFVSELAAADIGILKRAEARLLVFADVNTSHSKMVHVPVFGRARVFSASWVGIARSLSARVVAMTAVRDGRTIRLDGVELGGALSPARTLDAAFAYMQGRVADPGDWDMIVSHGLYFDCATAAADSNATLARWAAMAACDADVTRLVAQIACDRSGAPEAQYAVHAAEAEAVRKDSLEPGQRDRR